MRKRREERSLILHFSFFSSFAIWNQIYDAVTSSSPMLRLIKLFSLNKTRVICGFHHLRRFVLICFAREEASFPCFLFACEQKDPPIGRDRDVVRFFSSFPGFADASFFAVSPRIEMKIPFFRGGSPETRRHPVISCFWPFFSFFYPFLFLFPCFLLSLYISLFY